MSTISKQLSEGASQAAVGTRFIASARDLSREITRITANKLAG